MNRQALILENSEGQVVRSFNWSGEALVVYLNHDTHRVEVAADANLLDEAAFRYTIIGEAKRKDLEGQGIDIARCGRIRLVSAIGKTVELVTLPSDSNERIKRVSKWTAIGHGLLALLLLISSLIISSLQPELPPPVTVFYQDRPEPKPIVKATEKRIVRPTFKAMVAERTVKPKTPAVTARKQTTKIRTQVNLSKVGALGALGGISNGKKGSAGFNVNATNSSLGTSLTEVGKGGSGGLERAVHGQGLVNADVGTGGIKGSSGYATRGKGGGRPGYGKMSMVGGSSGYFLPLGEEALIEGGLDKEQIAAVVQRHLGEVIYCYEKGLQSRPTLAGRVGIFFVINGAGRVGTARINQTSLESRSVESCILDRLRGWQFPKPVGGVNVKVTYPFVLRRVG